VSIVQTRYTPVPTITARSGELLDVATIHEGIDTWDPVGLMETTHCMTTDSVALFPCPPTVMPVITQSASATATTGGTLAAGTYRAKVTAVNSRGETVASNEISQTTTGAASTVIFNWPNATGETGYKVYLTNGAANSEAVYVSRPADSTSYVLTAWPPAGSAAGTPTTANTAVVSTTKTFSLPSWQDGFRFAVYGGLACKGPSYNGEQGLADLKDTFLANESVGVERAFLTTRFVAGAGWAAPTDITPAGGAVSPVAGLALLEGDAAGKYAGVPTIHAPRAVGTMLTQNGAMVRVGNQFFSGQGSKVASGGGYGDPNSGPTGTAPAAGEMWMYASGEVVLARGEVFARTELDRTTNDVYTLVERLYVGAIDCYTAAIRVKVI
jgi:hypothetical protein